MNFIENIETFLCICEALFSRFVNGQRFHLSILLYIIILMTGGIKNVKRINATVEEHPSSTAFYSYKYSAMINYISENCHKNMIMASSAGVTTQGGNSTLKLPGCGCI